MIARIVVVLAAALVLATAGGCGAAGSRTVGETITVIGTVEFHQGNPGRGGAADPSGYVLRGQKDYEPLYLRENKSFNDPGIAKFVHQKVEVSGHPNYYTVNSDNPTSILDQVVDYWVLDVISIEAAGKQPEASHAATSEGGEPKPLTRP